MMTRIFFFTVLLLGSTGWAQNCGATYFCEAKCRYFDAIGDCGIGYEYVYADGATMSTTFDKLKAQCDRIGNAYALPKKEPGKVEQQVKQQGKKEGCAYPPWLEVVSGVLTAIPSVSCRPVP